MKINKVKILVYLIICSVSVYFFASIALYLNLTQIDIEKNDSNPKSFYIRDSLWSGDYKIKPIESYETIRFSPRISEKVLLGWFIPSEKSNKIVILVHGLGSQKGDSRLLLISSMLNKAGISSFIFDLREHGNSFIDDSRTDLGQEEYLDVLGAWDFVKNLGYQSESIGIYGVSLGAVTTIIAASNEPEIETVFLDSPFSSHITIIQEELIKKKFPKILTYGGLFVAKYVFNHNLTKFDIQNSILNSNLKNVFLTHRIGDERINFQHSLNLKKTFETKNSLMEFWRINGNGHVTTVYEFPFAYENKITQFFYNNL